MQDSLNFSLKQQKNVLMYWLWLIFLYDEYFYFFMFINRNVWLHSSHVIIWMPFCPRWQKDWIQILTKFGVTNMPKDYLYITKFSVKSRVKSLYKVYMCLSEPYLHVNHSTFYFLILIKITNKTIIIKNSSFEILNNDKNSVTCHDRFNLYCVYLMVICI